MTSFNQWFSIFTSVIAIRRLRTHSSVCVLALLIIAAISSSLYVIYFVQPSYIMLLMKQNYLMRTSAVNAGMKEITPAVSQDIIQANNESLKKISQLHQQEKETLEKKVSDCQGEKKSLATSFNSEKETHQKTNVALIDKIKLLEQEKNKTQLNIRKLKEEKKILEDNVTIHRAFFNYAAAMLRHTPYPGVENYTRYTVAHLGMSPLAGVEPLKPEYGPVVNNVTSFRYPLTIPACQINVTTAAANQSSSVFVAVISAPGNFDKRNTIRRTWRNHFKVDYHKSSMGVAGFAFILGLTGNKETQVKIEEESQTHGDIIQIEMDDAYRNLSLKVAGLFNWLHKNCPKIDFLFKVDDDVYVNVRNLAHFVQSFHGSNESMFGLPAKSSLTPIRGGKWGISLEDWPWNSYPGYYLGPAVLFSGRTILPLLAAFQTTPMMPFDDIYYSGMCAEKAGFNRTSFSSNYTTVYAMSQPVVPLACDLRRLISWLTVSATHMNNSHVSTDDFYGNRTQCLVAGSNGTNTTVDHNEPAKFFFV